MGYIQLNLFPRLRCTVIFKVKFAVKNQNSEIYYFSKHIYINIHIFIYVYIHVYITIHILYQFLRNDLLRHCIYIYIFS